MNRGNLKRIRSVIFLLVASMGTPSAVRADNGGPRMQAPKWPFVSGVVAAEQSGVPSIRRTGPQNPPPEEVHQPWDIIAHIKDIHNVAKASVVLRDPWWESPVLQTEWQFKNSGCATRDPSRIAGLIDLLKRSNLKTARPPILATNGSESIYLTLANGEEINVWFAFPDHAADAVLGAYRSGYGPMQKLVASPSLPKELYLWVEKTGEIATDNAACREWDQKQIEKLFESVEAK